MRFYGRGRIKPSQPHEALDQDSILLARMALSASQASWTQASRGRQSSETSYSVGWPEKTVPRQRPLGALSAQTQASRSRRPRPSQMPSVGDGGRGVAPGMAFLGQEGQEYTPRALLGARGTRAVGDMRSRGPQFQSGRAVKSPVSHA